jgi:hypothetical protein
LKGTKGDNLPDFWSVNFQLNENLIPTHHRMSVIINSEHIGVFNFKLIQELQKEVKSTAVDILDIRTSKTMKYSQNAMRI